MNHRNFQAFQVSPSWRFLLFIWKASLLMCVDLPVDVSILLCFFCVKWCKRALCNKVTSTLFSVFKSQMVVLHTRSALEMEGRVSVNVGHSSVMSLADNNEPKLLSSWTLYQWLTATDKFCTQKKECKKYVILNLMTSPCKVSGFKLHGVDEMSVQKFRNLKTI